MNLEAPPQGKLETTTISSRIHVLSALRRLLEKEDLRRVWKPQKIAREIWQLTPELRHQYRGDWNGFWAVNQRRFPHILDGDYDKLEQEQLHIGFRNFLEHNFPEALRLHGPPRSNTVLDVARTLDGFFAEPRYPQIEVRGGNEPILFGVANANATRDPDRKYWMAWSPLQEARQCPAVLFSTNVARFRYEGFMLPRLGIAMFRGVDDATEFVFAAMERPSDSRSSMACKIVHNAFGLARFSPLVSVYPTLDREALEVATALLKNLDKPNDGA